MEAKLVMIGGDDQARQYDLQLPTVIGRSRSTDLRLGHPLISRQHCEVFEVDGMLMVRDLGSLNGTFVGDLRIAQEAMPVKPGDLLTIGPVTFRAEYFVAAASDGEPSTWDAQGPTCHDPLPSGGDDEPELRLRDDDDDETSRPGE